MKEDQPTINVRPRSKDELEALEKEIANLREQYEKRKNWSEIEKMLREDVDDTFKDIKLKSAYIRENIESYGKKDKEDDDDLLSKFQRTSKRKLTDYESGATRDDLEKYDSLINEIFNKKQVKNQKYFKAFLTCDTEESIAKRARCTKQYIQKLFHEKAIEFLKSEKFIAIAREIAIRKRVIQEEKAEILKTFIPDIISSQEEEVYAFEEAWNRFENGDIPDYGEREKKHENAFNSVLDAIIKDFTPRKLKQILPCGT